MAPSVSRQKRLQERAAKKAAGASSTDPSSRISTPAGSVNGRSTPLTSNSGMPSKTNSQEDLLSMAKLNIATERYSHIQLPCVCTDCMSRSAAGVLVSDVKGRDIKIDAYTLSFHGRLLIEGAEISFNYGNRYGLLGENGSGKVCRVPEIRFANPLMILVNFPPIYC